MTEIVTFTALEDFSSKKTSSTYVKGLSYTARPEDDVLHSLLDGWVRDGKIELGGRAAKIRGEG